MSLLIMEARGNQKKIRDQLVVVVSGNLELKLLHDQTITSVWSLDMLRFRY